MSAWSCSARTLAVAELLAHLRAAHTELQKSQDIVYDTGREPVSLFKRLALNRAQNIVLRLIIWIEND